MIQLLLAVPLPLALLLLLSQLPALVAAMPAGAELVAALVLLNLVSAVAATLPLQPRPKPQLGRTSGTGRCG